MIARPILFSGPMVRALLEGRKTQTRRICKYDIYSNGIRFDRYLGDIVCHNDYLPPSAMLMDVERGKHRYTTSNVEGWAEACPYGVDGDLLWVRETWGEFIRRPGVPVYRADDPLALGSSNPWRPSIHMPRRHSRLTLKITDVRVERLQDITQPDCVAEGIPSETNGFLHHVVADYRKLWTQINGPGSWDPNPWVWALTFEVIKRNVDDVLRDAKAAA